MLALYIGLMWYMIRTTKRQRGMPGAAGGTKTPASEAGAMPQLLMNKYNGFYSREVVDMFVTYANKMIDSYGDRVKRWISFNEQNAIALQGSSKVAYGCLLYTSISRNIYYHS